MLSQGRKFTQTVSQLAFLDKSGSRHEMRMSVEVKNNIRDFSLIILLWTKICDVSTMHRSIQ